jgi:hypothetical protein
LGWQYPEIESFEFESKDIFILYRQINLIYLLFPSIRKDKLNLCQLPLVVLVAVLYLHIHYSRLFQYVYLIIQTFFTASTLPRLSECKYAFNLREIPAQMRKLVQARLLRNYFERDSLGMLGSYLKLLFLVSHSNVTFFGVFEMELNIIELNGIGKGVLHVESEDDGLIYIGSS